MTSDPDARAARRLRRTRAIMTLLFTATTALCLALLGALALQLDTTSRAEQLGSDVSERAGGLARAVYFEADTLHLEPLAEDELARGATAVAVYRVENGQISDTEYRTGRSFGDLQAEQREALIARVLDEQGPALTALPASGGSKTGEAGGDLIWAAAPVWNSDSIEAVVVVGQDARAASAAHDRLAIGLVLGCIVLLAAAAAAGFLLSGRAMRPATRALAQQEQFLAEAAHELRTPLTSLRLLVESGEPGTSQRALVAVDRLDHLITGLLARARIDAGSYEQERIRLRLDQLVRLVVEEFGENPRLHLESDAVVVTGDPGLLTQAIRNLIENALRHAAESPVLVTVADGAVTVSDHGPGIAANRREAVRERGVGTGSGTGTGLAIVSWVTALHGGELSLTDAPGGGLRAELRLPPGA